MDTKQLSVQIKAEIRSQLDEIVKLSLLTDDFEVMDIMINVFEEITKDAKDAKQKALKAKKIADLMGISDFMESDR